MSTLRASEVLDDESESLADDAPPRLGVLECDVAEAAIEATALSKSKRSELLVSLAVAQDTQRTPPAAKSANPVWDAALALDVPHGRAALRVRLLERTRRRGGERERTLGLASLQLGKIGPGFDKWIDLYPAGSSEDNGKSTKRRSKSTNRDANAPIARVHLVLTLRMSGVNRLLSAVSNAHEEESGPVDEKESVRELLRHTPELVRSLRLTVFRLIYAIEPVLMFRKQVMELLLWHSKPSSAFVLFAWLYIVYVDQVFSVLAVALSAVAFWSAVSALRGPNSHYRLAETFEDTDELIEKANDIKNRSRIGAKTSILTDMRAVLRILSKIADAAESVRTIGNDSRRAGVLGGVFVLLAMFGSYTRIRFFASVVLRLVLFLGGLYAFTLLPLYHHFPEFRERYSVSVLVRKFVSLVNPSSYRFGASSSTGGKHKHDKFAGKTTDELLEIVLKMHDKNGGVPVKDRRIEINKTRKRISSAFIATQAIDWLYCNCECDSRRSAVALLRGLANTGAIELVFDGNLVESEALPGTPGGDKSQRASLVNTVTRRRRRSALAASSDSALTDRDWQVLLTGAERRTFEPGETIIEQATNNSNLFRLVAGDCVVEKIDEHGHSIKLANIGPPMLLGELSALDSRLLSTATVRAAPENAVEADVLRLAFVHTLFASEPQICRRFFHAVALRLADRLDAIGRDGGKQTSKTPRTTIVTNDSKRVLNNVASTSQALMAKAAMFAGVKEPESADERFASIFKVKSDIVLHEYPAQHLFKIGHAHGSLFLTQKYIGFCAKSFGRQRKILVPYEAIESVAPSESSDARLKLVTKTHKRIKFRLESAADTKQAISLVSGLVAGKEPERETSSLKGKVTALRDDVRAEVDKKRVELKSEVSKATKEAKKRARRSSTFLGNKVGLAVDSLVGADDFDVTDEAANVADDGSEVSLLTRVDWDTILACSHVSTFKTGEALMSEGEKPIGIMQIVRGSANIAKNGKTIASVASGQILGEISFLRNSAATADVIADGSAEEDGEVDVHVIPSERLRLLFVQQPSLAGKVYHHLAMILSDRITDRQSAKVHHTTVVDDDVDEIDFTIDSEKFKEKIDN